MNHSNHQAWQSPVPEKYKSSHLFLLVGGNPLPNAVAAKCLLKENGERKVFLVHTGGESGTFKIAQNLQSWLLKERIISKKEDANFVEVGDSMAEKILLPIKCQLECLATDASVGLHYTGGTKAMAVHAYRSIEAWAKEPGRKPIYSYLDARTLEICFDPVNIAAGNTTARYFVGTVHIPLTDIIKLHGWSAQQGHEPVVKPILPETTVRLAEVYSDENKAKQWREWWNGQTRTGTFPSHPELSPAVTSLKQELGALEVTFDGCSFDFEEAKEKTGFALGSKGKSFKDWLIGEWLDSYCLRCVQEIAEDVGLDECLMDLKTDPVDFQSDVIVIRGYQLFYFTCTVRSKKPDVKLKLFEGYIRAKQLAGDQARVALVCCTDEPKIIQKEMKQELEAGSQISVFGRSSLINLAREIRQWIEENKGKDSSEGGW
jgi:hypothetical protein